MAAQLVIPQDDLAEDNLIGACFVGKAETLTKAAAIVRPDDLRKTKARDAFAAMLRLHEQAQPLDTTLVANAMEQRDPAYLAGCAAGVPTHVHVEAYARRVRYCATARQLLATAQDLARLALTRTSSENTEELLVDEAQARFERVLERSANRQTLLTPERLTLAYSEVLEARERRDPDLIGHDTGFSDLDRHVAYRPGELWYIAAAPGRGKTALLGSLQDRLARRSRTSSFAAVPSLFASAEMGATQLMDRAIAADTKIDSWQIARGRLSEAEWREVNAALAKRHEEPAYLYEDASMTTTGLEAVLRLAAARHRVRVCFLDYAQLLADRVAEESEYARVTQISRRLVRIARRLRVCLVAACQVSRVGAERPDGMPRLQDLRSSGQLEQDADVVLGLGREPGATEAAVQILKNRNGPGVGEVVRLYFDPRQARFHSMAGVGKLPPAHIVEAKA